MILKKTIGLSVQMFENKTNIVVFFYFAHAHCCLKFIIRHKFAEATDLEFIAAEKKNNKKK
jgi:hypothetical protein